ncbi:MAG: peptidyl-prolyl cis-trans isomerase [Acidobacteria bacterium]|nr:peptidyl-prolyl cis-trans isomerase [Acidobacteriota bacterium]
MRPIRPHRPVTLLFACLTLLAPALAADLPVIDGEKSVASVNGEPITLDSVEREIARLHAGHLAGERSGQKQDPSALLERMITSKLIAQEARNIGLDELADSRAEFQRLELETLRDVFVRRVLADVKEPDPAQVERIYKNSVREFRVASVMLASEADAKDAAAKARSGADFDKLVQTLAITKNAQRGDARQFLKSAELLPQVRQALEKMKPGEVSPPIASGKSWVLFQLLELRYPENAGARAEARETALQEKRARVLEKFVAELVAKNATVDAKRVEALDFEAPGAFEKLARDTRPVAQVKGDKPVTVADLAAGMQQRFFHGVDKAVTAKRINREKRAVLDDVLNRRIVVAEARRRGIQDAPEYGRALAWKKEAYLFGTFVARVIQPEVRVQEQDLKSYLAAHKDEYTAPEMVRVDAIAFAARRDAEATLEKLRRGADFNWLKGNAAGQVTADKTVPLPEGLVVLDSLPAGMRTALAGARAGDTRFYGEGQGPFYVLRVSGHQDPKPLPLDAVREAVGRRVIDEKIARAVGDWGAKLRKASEVKVYATGERLTRLVMKDLAPPK